MSRCNKINGPLTHASIANRLPEVMLALCASFLNTTAHARFSSCCKTLLRICNLSLSKPTTLLFVLGGDDTSVKSVSWMNDAYQISWNGQTCNTRSLPCMGGVCDKVLATVCGDSLFVVCESAASKVTRQWDRNQSKYGLMSECRLGWPDTGWWVHPSADGPHPTSLCTVSGHICYQNSSTRAIHIYEPRSRTWAVISDPATVFQLEQKKEEVEEVEEVRREHQPAIMYDRISHRWCLRQHDYQRAPGPPHESILLEIAPGHTLAMGGWNIDCHAPTSQIWERKKEQHTTNNNAEKREQVWELREAWELPARRCEFSAVYNPSDRSIYICGGFPSTRSVFTATLPMDPNVRIQWWKIGDIPPRRFATMILY